MTYLLLDFVFQYLFQVFVQIEAKMQQHIEVRIPDVKEELVKLCKTLDLKIAIEEQNVWLIGNPLVVNIAQKHLNKVYVHDLFNVVVDCSDSSFNHTKRLQKMYHLLTNQQPICAWLYSLAR